MTPVSENPIRPSADSAVPSPGRGERLWPWLLGALALLPLAVGWRSFSEVWWFGDEWDQLDQIARLGFWRWTFLPFGENIVPLFKLTWGGLVHLSGGSYWPMLLAVWLTHALNTVLFARVLRRAGFQWGGAALAASVFALTVANSEILGWSIQWSNVLSALLLLGGLSWLLHHPATDHGWNWRTHGVLSLFAAASALAFVRGVLTGPVLAVGVLLLHRHAGEPWFARWRGALHCLLPGLAIAAWIYFSAPGNHHTMGRDGVALRAMEFAGWFWSAVPLHRLAELSRWDGPTTLLLGALKLTLVVWALRRSRGAQRTLLLLLLLCDLGNAALLGLGRYHTGLQFANSSRYYYTALLCTLPFVAFAFDVALAPLRATKARWVVTLALVAAAAFAVARRWPAEAALFAEHRGRNTRQVLLLEPQPPAEGAVPGIPFLPTARAKELIGIYNLH